MSRAWTFVVATLAVSWLAAGLFAVTGIDWNSIPATFFAIGYMFVPLIVAMVLARGDDRSIREVLGVRFSLNWWWLFAWLFPVAVAVVTLGVSLLVPGVEFTSGLEGMIERYRHLLPADQIELMRESVEQLPAHPFWLALIQGLVAGATINAVAAFGEEAGWRGYLYDKWRGLGFWQYSAAVGGIWGIWHAPIILQGHNYPEHPVAGVGMMILFCLLYSPVFTFVRDRSESVVAAAILHGTINAVAGLALIPLVGGSDLLVGVTGLAGLLTLAVVDLVLWWFRPDAAAFQH